MSLIKINRLRYKALALRLDTSGATAIQYGLIAALIGAGTVGAVTSVGSKVSSTAITASKAIASGGSFDFIGEEGIFSMEDLENLANGSSLHEYTQEVDGWNASSAASALFIPDESARYNIDGTVKSIELPPEVGGYYSTWGTGSSIGKTFDGLQEGVDYEVTLWLGHTRRPREGVDSRVSATFNGAEVAVFENDNGAGIASEFEQVTFQITGGGNNRLQFDQEMTNAGFSIAGVEVK